MGSSQKTAKIVGVFYHKQKQKRLSHPELEVTRLYYSKTKNYRGANYLR